MDLRKHLLDLFAPVQVGDELLDGVRLIGASTELGLRLTVETAGREIHLEVAPANEGGRHAARSKHFLFSYRAGGGEGGLDPLFGKSLCERVAKRALAREELVLADLMAEAQATKTTVHNNTKVREVQVERLVELAHAGPVRYYTLSPYVGCLIGCRFCYSQTRLSMVRRLAGLPEIKWGSWVDVRVNAAQVLKEEIHSLTPRAIKFCPIVSDPYQAVEPHYQITRQCLEVLRDAPEWPVFVLTRSKLIVRDAELIGSLARGYGGASIPTFDDSVRKHFEPRGASISERFSVLRTLKEAGAGTIAVIQPMLPGPLEPFIDALAEVADSVSIDVLRGEVGAEADFSDPRYSFSRDKSWQLERAMALMAGLEERGVEVWRGELPQWAVAATEGGG